MRIAVAAIYALICFAALSCSSSRDSAIPTDDVIGGWGLQQIAEGRLIAGTGSTDLYSLWLGTTAFNTVRDEAEARLTADGWRKKPLGLDDPDGSASITLQRDDWCVSVVDFHESTGTGDLVRDLNELSTRALAEAAAAETAILVVVGRPCGA